MNARVAMFLAIAALTVSAFGLVACGGGDDGSTDADSQTGTPESAIAEIEPTRAGLEQALKLYKAGDEKGAASKASDTYLDHFELVEGPLRDADEDLMLKIEAAIRTNLILNMQDGYAVDAIQRQVDDISTDLDEAKKTLQAAQ